MNIVQIYARDSDGVIRHIFTPNGFGTPEAGTTRVARFDSNAYPLHYNRISSLSPFIRFIGGALVLEDPVLGTSTVADSAWIAARGAEVAAAEFKGEQVNVARNTLQTLMNGLDGLNAADKGYAVYGRIFAARNGATQQTIDGITNKATAQAYITGLTEWQNMTAASKAFFAKELEANAGLTMVLLLVLT